MHSAVTHTSNARELPELQSIAHELGVAGKLGQLQASYAGLNRLTEWNALILTGLKDPKIDPNQLLDTAIKLERCDPSLLSTCLSKLSSEATEGTQVDLKPLEKLLSTSAASTYLCSAFAQSERSGFASTFTEHLETPNISFTAAINSLANFCANFSNESGGPQMQVPYFLAATELLMFKQEQQSPDDMQRLADTIKAGHGKYEHIGAAFSASVRAHRRGEQEVSTLFKRLDCLAEQLALAQKELIAEPGIDLQKGLATLFEVSPHYYAALTDPTKVDHPINNLITMLKATVVLSEFFDGYGGSSSPDFTSAYTIGFIKALGPNFDPDYSATHFNVLTKSVTQFAKDSNFFEPPHAVQSILRGVIENVLSDPQLGEVPLENFIRKLPKLLQNIRELTINHSSKSKVAKPGCISIFLGLTKSLKSDMVAGIDSLISITDKLKEHSKSFGNHGIFLEDLLPTAHITHEGHKRNKSGTRTSFQISKKAILGEVFEKTDHKYKQRTLQELDALLSSEKTWRNDPAQLSRYLHYRAENRPGAAGDVISFGPFGGHGAFAPERCYIFLKQSRFLAAVEIAGFIWKSLRSAKN